MTALSEYIAASGESTRTFAKRVGVSASYIQALMRGDSVPTVPIAASIEAATGGKVPILSWASQPPSQQPRDPGS